VAEVEKIMDTLNSVWLQDEAVRYKKSLQEKERFGYWMKKRLDEDERGLEVKLPPIPKYIKSDFKFTPASAVGFARTIIKSLIP
jgi:hypothetical protein